MSSCSCCSSEASEAEAGTPRAAAPCTAIILAAGEGTRMKSKHAKVAHEVLGKPMIRWVADAAIAGGCGRVVVVVGSHADEVRAIVADAYADAPARVECVEQAERLGTGHAVRVALEEAGVSAGPVVVLNGDLPLVRPETIRSFAETVSAPQPGAAPAHAASILTFTAPDPHGYGRVELDEAGSVVRIVEQKDCTPEQDATLLECNAGCYAFDGAQLAVRIGEVGCDNSQHEYYLTDMVEILRSHGASVTFHHVDDYTEGLGVNSRVQLAQLTAIARDQINERLMLSGVTMLDPTQVWVGPDVTVGRDTQILPGCILTGRTSVGEDCVIGPDTRLTDTRVGDRCVVDETVALQAVLDDDVESGPRAYLRPGAHLMDGSKAGTHVEIKKSVIGPGSKVPHLSYVGDATIGADVNLGAGTITCNYDGKNKHATTIGDRTFIGSDTMMVAPVNIGDDAITGASSCITRDVPSGALAVERNDQRIIEGYTEKRRARL